MSFLSGSRPRWIREKSSWGWGESGCGGEDGEDSDCAGGEDGDGCGDGEDGDGAPMDEDGDF